VIEVARLIADPPPEGLVQYLEHWRDLVGATKPGDHQAVFDKMVWATDFLIDKLRLFQPLPAGMQCPEEVTIALAVLPKVRKRLAPMVAPRPKRRPTNIFHEACARVVVNACHRFGMPKAKDRLYEVCQAYWEACGGEEVRDWRRDVREILAGPPWLDRTLEAYISR
jgi:hypothetical protein